MERMKKRLKRLLLTKLLFTQETKVFNNFLFFTGRKYSRLLQVWFSVGVFFGVLAMVTSVLLLALQALKSNSPKLRDTEQQAIISVVVPGVNVPWSHILYISIATTVSVVFHELGHALAAASEGVPTDHVAVFSILVVLSGAYVALNRDALDYLSSWRLLRVLSAGIWHNVVLCAICWLLLGLFPWLALPFYSRDNGLVVLAAPNSLLMNHLRQGDVIKALDGRPIRGSKDWLQSVQQVEQTGFCVPSDKLNSSNNSCNGNTLADVLEFEASDRSSWCFNASQVLKCKQCTSSIVCSKDSVCLRPKLPDGAALVQLFFAPFDDPNCKAVPPEKFLQSSCTNTGLLFMGRPASLAHSLWTTDYMPRFGGAWLPSICESLITYNFSVSATLAVLNSAPVFYLDGQDILGCIMSSCLSLRRKRKKLLLRACLSGGTLLLVVAILRSIFSVK